MQLAIGLTKVRHHYRKNVFWGLFLLTFSRHLILVELTVGHSLWLMTRLTHSTKDPRPIPHGPITQ